MKRVVLAMLFGLAACGKSGDPTTPAAININNALGRETVADPALGNPTTRLACLRQSRGLVLIGHRGGPTRNFPPNALETLERSFEARTHGMEIDVAQTRDGKLYLVHDDTLERATTGHGAPDSLFWADVQRLNLRAGKTVTSYHPASLDAVLGWAVARHALIELDRKDTTSFEAMADAVHLARAENNVLVVTYIDAQAEDVHAKAADLTIVAAIHSPEQLDRLVKRP